MFESELDRSKIRIYSGNILRNQCDGLVLYECKEPSHLFNRLSQSQYLSKHYRQDVKGNMPIQYFKTPQLPFKSVFIINAIGLNSAPSYKTLAEAAVWVNGFIINNPCKVTFNLTASQDVESYKNFIDRIMSGRQIQVDLTGHSKAVGSMYSYLHQSGHMLTNASINTSEIIQVFFDKLSCSKCKKIDMNFKLSLSNSEIYCSSCAPYNVGDPSLFVKKTLAKLKDLCYCGKDYFLRDKAAHMAGCQVGMLGCQFCNFEGGQADFMEHTLQNHARAVIERLNEVSKVVPEKSLKVQCKDCGEFWEQTRECPCKAKLPRPTSFY